MTLEPNESEFVSMVEKGEPVVIRLEASLDVDADPLTAYSALTDGADHGFLLESAEKIAASDPDGAFDPAHVADERHARYSFVGYDPAAVVRLHPSGDSTVLRRDGLPESLVSPGTGDVLDRLRSTLPAIPKRGFPDTDRQLLDGGLVGFLAYDAVYDLWLEEVGVERPDTTVPDAEFVLATRVVVFDHREDSLSLVLTPILTPDHDPRSVYAELEGEVNRVRAVLDRATPPGPGGIHVTDRQAGTREEYEAAVRRAKQAVFDGELYQVVLSRTREIEGSVDPIALYDALRTENPSPYMYLLGHEDRTIVGASPETLLSVNGDTVLNNPIAGTCPRGGSPVEDRRLAGEMLADPKERAEHTMLVDLARNDVRRVAEAGSVAVPEFMSVLKYSHVQHIESTVTGTLRPDSDAFDAIRASFPAGTLSGAPKIRAMEYIHDLETRPRGVYGGGVGYVSWSGDAEFAIVIRTATIEHGEVNDDDSTTRDVLRVRAGAGIVADSEPAAEFDETESKMDGTLAALDRLEGPTEVPR
ncbi:MAG: anthranilate synthase component I [Halodesulfurarchaeum sp.]